MLKIQNISPFIAFLSLLVLLSCNSVSINNHSQTQTKNELVLGMVGLKETQFLNRTYTPLAIPKYKTPIRLSVAAIAFNEKTHQAFQQAQALHPKAFEISYADSLSTKPQFIQFSIVEPLSLVDQLNADYNTNLRANLEFQKESSVITNISIAFPKEDLDKILTSDEVYLVQNDQHVNLLKLVKHNKVLVYVKFTKGQTFSYSTLSCCWHQNSKYQLEIVNLVEHNQNCINKSNRSAKKVKRDIDYLKF